MTEIPSSENSATLADWGELFLIREELPRLTYSRLDRIFRGELLELAEIEFDQEAPDGHEEDTAEDVDLATLGPEGEATRDARIDLMLEEIELREQLGGDVYPFRANEYAIASVSKCGESIYRLLLVLSSSQASYRKDRRTHEVERVYDLIAMEALKVYLGRSAVAVRFAKNDHDPDDPDTRPKRFREAIDWLRDHLDAPVGQKTPPDEEVVDHWEADLDDPRRPVPNSYYDGGVDAVIWWRFKDGRRGYPVLLAQCTVQLTWERKVHDIRRDLWPKWIDFSMVPPQRALVIPFAVDRTSETFEDRSVEAGVVIDRLRLLELLAELECSELESMIDEETKKWTGKELATIR